MADTYMEGEAPRSFRTQRFVSRARSIRVSATDEQRKITGNTTITTYAPLLENAPATKLEGTVASYAAHLLDLDPRVEDLRSEPLTIYYDDGLNKGKYHPDLLVTYKPGTTGRHPNVVLYEFKMRQFLRADLEKWLPRFYAAHALCLARGWAFRVVTEVRILRFYAAYSFLSCYTHYDIEPGLKLSLLDLATDLSGVQVWDMIAQFPGRKLEALAAVWTLLAHGLVSADLSKPLTNKTLIYPAYSGPRERVL